MAAPWGAELTGVLLVDSSAALAVGGRIVVPVRSPLVAGPPQVLCCHMVAWVPGAFLF